MGGISFSLYLHKHCLCLLSTAAADYPRLGAFKEWTDFLVLEAWEFRMKGPHPVRTFLSFCFVLLCYMCMCVLCTRVHSVWMHMLAYACGGPGQTWSLLQLLTTLFTETRYLS